jgi:hypothetical protein
LDFLEKKELVVESYRSLFNKESSYKDCGLNEDEIKVLEKDIEFQERLNFYLRIEQKTILNKLKSLSESLHDPTALKATLELGRIFSPELFVAKEVDKDKKPFEANINLKIIKTALTQDEHAAEVLGILAESGYLQPKVEDPLTAEAN